MPRPSPVKTRVAVCQLDFIPGIRFNRQSAIENPSFSLSNPTVNWLDPPESVSDPIKEKLKLLKRCVRDIYNAQLLQKLTTILEACREWKVKVVVFPEYSIPWEILRDVMILSRGMTVVAGTHTVERQAIEANVYSLLGWPQSPDISQAVCPVFHDGLLVALQPKMTAAKPEVASLTLGKTWEPIDIPGIVDQMGVLICLDFLYRERDGHRELVGKKLDSCGFLAVPSLTPYFTTGEFEAVSHQEAFRYRRPVLYSDCASGGGSSIYVDTGRTGGKSYPDVIGKLHRNDEGVLIADVDLGYEARGDSTPFNWAPPILPFAGASLVYERHPLLHEYSQWNQSIASAVRPIFELIDDISARRTQVRDVIALRQGVGCQFRSERLQRMLDQIDGIDRADELQTFLREIAIPSETLPIRDLQAALCLGCSELVERWSHEPGGDGLREAAKALANAGSVLRELPTSEWTDNGTKTISRIVEQIRSIEKPLAAGKQSTQATEIIRIPKGVRLSSLGNQRIGNVELIFGSAGDLYFNQTKYGLDVVSRHFNEAFYERRLDFLKLHFLMMSEGADEVCNLVAFEISEEASSTELIVEKMVLGIVVTQQGLDRQLWLYPDVGQLPQSISFALPALRSFDINSWSTIDPYQLSDRVENQRSRFTNGLRSSVTEYRNQLLQEVSGVFVDPYVLDESMEPTKQSFLTSVEHWLTESTVTTLLILGEYGSGKSTALAEWCYQRAIKTNPLVDPNRPDLVLVNLAEMAPGMEPLEMILKTCDVEDTPPNRAALQALIISRRLVPVFDGFDEMATRITPESLSSQLAMLLEVAGRYGRVVISSRDHYFPREQDLSAAWQQALANTLGQSAGVVKLHVQLFDEAQIKRLVLGIAGAGDADLIVQRIVHQYPLQELAQRPLLLGMVLKTINTFEDSASISRADLYNAYLNRWVEQTDRKGRELFDASQKITLARHVAAQLWRSKRASLGVEELSKIVREILAKELPDDMPVGAALLEIFGGSFFVREATDHFRFAHKSFLEFFVALDLTDATQTVASRFDTQPITREVAGFVLELLRREGDPLRHPAFEELQVFLTRGRRTDSASTAVAATNVMRLLLNFRHWNPDLQSLFHARANFDHVSLTGEAIANVDWSGSTFAHARFINCKLEQVDFSQCSFVDAQFNGSTLNRCDFSEATGKNVSFKFVSATSVNMERSHWSGTDWSHGNWLSTHSSPTDSRDEPRQVDAVGADWAMQREAKWEAFRPRIESAHRGSVWSVSWESGGGRLASGGEDGTVRVWDATSGDQLQTLSGHLGRVGSVSWESGGGRLASGGEDGTVRVWDATNGAQLRSLWGHHGRVSSVSWKSGGGRLASSGDDGTVRVWDATSGEQLQSLSGYPGRVSSVSWESHGGRLATGGVDGTVQVWDATSGKQLQTLTGHDGNVLSLTWESGGGRLASSSDDGTVRVWDTTSGEQLNSLSGHTSSVTFVSWENSRGRLASSGHDGTVRVWDATSGEQLHTLSGHTSVKCVSWENTGGRLASCGEDGTVRVWDATSGEQLLTLSGHSGSVTSVSWDGSGGCLASGGEDGTVRVWDATSGEQLHTLSSHSGAVKCVSWESGGVRIASGGASGRLNVWDATSGGLLQSIALQTVYVTGVSWESGGGRLASSGTDGMVLVWDATSGEPLQELFGHDGIVLSVKWESGGGRLASSGYDGTVRVWDATSGDPLLILSHSGHVWSVSWESGGSRLASCGEDGTVRVWDATNGDQLQTLSGHRGRVRSVSWESGGGRLASSGSDGTVRVWNATSNGAIDDGPVKPLLVLETLYESALAVTAIGYARFSNDKTFIRLAKTHTGPGYSVTTWFPLGGWETVLGNPERFQQALQGKATLDDLKSDLRSAGYPMDFVELPTKVEVVERTTTNSSKTLDNPFVPGSGLPARDQLFGRDEILTRVRTLMRKANPCVIRGPRRSGKTWLLQALSQELSDNNHRVYSQTLEASDASDESGGIRNRDQLALLLDPTLESFDRPSIEFTKQALANSERRTVLMLDEIVHLRQAQPGLFAWLRSLGQKGVAILYAGSHHDWSQVVQRAMSFPGSSFGNDTKTIDLEPLSNTMAAEFLLTRAPVELELNKNSSVIEWVVKRCGAWQFYLQVMGFELVEEHRAGRRQAFKNESDLEDLYRQQLIEGHHVVFESRWQDTPRTVRRVLLMSRNKQLPTLAEIAPAERRVLRDCGWITLRNYWLHDPTFLDWIETRRDELSEDKTW